MIFFFARGQFTEKKTDEKIKKVNNHKVFSLCITRVPQWKVNGYLAFAVLFLWIIRNLYYGLIPIIPSVLLFKLILNIGQLNSMEQYQYSAFYFPDKTGTSTARTINILVC